MIFNHSSVTSAGPRSANEDAVGVWTLKDGRVVAAVADGLGGMGAGARASALAIEMVANAVEQDRDFRNCLDDLLREIHAEIRSRQDEHELTRSMATTLSMVMLEDGRLWGGHCGDTRVMIARRNGIKRLTRDHSEAQRFLDQGKLTKQEYIDYPRKNILYSALGGSRELEVQLFNFTVEEGDWVLLTSDGIHQCVSMVELRDIAQEAIGTDDYVAQLLRVLGRKQISDNYSAVVIKVS